ncbi:MAG: lysophospholipid acyltransferase family protein [Rugosibacter sp.]|jgi:KDO2-lipid IV(A) lauroyltransferase
MSLLFRLCAYLPLSLLHNLGALIGWLTWAFSPTYRRSLASNLAQAGLSAYQHAAIAEAGKGFLELPKIWLRPHDEVVARVAKASGWALVEAAAEKGKGVLFLTPHLGCFEMTAQYIASKKPLTVMFRQPKQAWLEPLMRQGRGSNFNLAAADMSGVRRLLKALKQGELVGMLPDQVPGTGEGVWAPFFGRPAYTMTLAARLAETGATVILTYAERLPYGAGYHVYFLPLSQPLEGDLTQRATQINAEIEAMIRQCPAQYLWGYKRYKVPAGTQVP